jgi:hypothetical protein
MSVPCQHLRTVPYCAECCCSRPLESWHQPWGLCKCCCCCCLTFSASASFCTCGDDAPLGLGLMSTSLTDVYLRQGYGQQQQTLVFTYPHQPQVAKADTHSHVPAARIWDSSNTRWYSTYPSQPQIATAEAIHSCPAELLIALLAAPQDGNRDVSHDPCCYWCFCLELVQYRCRTVHVAVNNVSGTMQTKQQPFSSAAILGVCWELSRIADA